MDHLGIAFLTAYQPLQCFFGLETLDSGGESRCMHEDDFTELQVERI